MLNVLLTGALSFLVTFMALPAIMRVAREKRLFDEPDARKLHSKSIASLGGVGIFIGFFMALLLVSPSTLTTDFNYFFAAAMVIFFLGLKDDILVLSANKKFLGQMAATAIIVHFGHIKIDNLQGFLGIWQLPEYVSILFSYMTVIVIINAFNLIDGVDGLAGSLGLLTTSVFGIYFFLSGQFSFAFLAFAMTGALVAFLMFNYHPAKIFMGDSGSLLLGLVNAILVIRFMNVAYTGTELPVLSSGAIGFSLLILPLLDTLRVFSIRIYKGRSPFSPDRNHIHHLLLDRGLNHSQITIACVSLNIGFVALAYAGRHLGTTVLLGSMVATFYTMIGSLLYFRRPLRKLVVTRGWQAQPASITSTTKVVSIKTEAAAAEQ
jgi:UDP-GlcNAc:undecaprenyl-phosphate/decaprenyl-phosphate GlcNAc-1-phosphate transferase